MNTVIITNKPIESREVFDQTQDNSAGGMVHFFGTIRDLNNQKSVLGIDFSTYMEMAMSEMEKIVNEASVRWPCKQVYLSHRVGKLGLGDIAVVIGVSCVHRKEAFEACRFIIDNLKERVPIWKKEIYQDGSEWLNSRP